VGGSSDLVCGKIYYIPGTGKWGIEGNKGKVIGRAHVASMLDKRRGVPDLNFSSSRGGNRGKIQGRMYSPIM